MRGPPPKPTAIKAAEGNPGKRRLNRCELDQEPQAPSCPRWLDARARREFHKLVDELKRLRVLREVDEILLASLCDAYSTLVAAREALDKLPADARLLVKTPNGAVQQNPLLSIINAQKQILGRLAAEFGLSPSARARLTLEESGEDPHDALERLLTGHGVREPTDVEIQ